MLSNLADKIVDFLTSKKCKIPLIYINFNYPQYVQNGEKGSCICSVHPDLRYDEKLISMLNEVVDYIRGNYDMEKLTKL